MIAKFYGKSYSLETLRQKTYITREGVSLLGISEAAESIGFRTLGVHITFEKLLETPLPCIVHWKQNHFVVVYDLKVKKRSINSSSSVSNEESTQNGSTSSYEGTVTVADPAHGIVKYSVQEFLTSWLSTKSVEGDEGIALLFELAPDFYSIQDEKSDKTKFSFILQYLRPYKKLIVQLFLGMLVGLPLGKWLHAYVMSQIRIDTIAFDVRIAWQSVMFSMLLTAVFAVKYQPSRNAEWALRAMRRCHITLAAETPDITFQAQQLDL